jgi:aspartokinase
VVHHLAINQTTYLDIPIVVKNVINPTAPGTRIITSSSAGKPDATIPSKKTSCSSPPFAVTLLNDLEMVTVQFGDSFSGHPTLRVMDVLRTYLSDNATGLGLDLINSSQENVCFMIKGPGSRDASYEAGIQNAFDALRLIATVRPVFSSLADR